jgi:hypothetical protein
VVKSPRAYGTAASTEYVQRGVELGLAAFAGTIKGIDDNLNDVALL